MSTEAISLISNCLSLAASLVCLVAASRPQRPQPATRLRRTRRERN